MADIFHTFFGISGLSLLGYFSKNLEITEKNDHINTDLTNEKLKVSQLEVDANVVHTNFENYDGIDPTYALPIKIVKLLGLKKQILDSV